ncbi:6-bladed beta-propeller [candidate division KSB1 bacterium]
MHTRLVVSLLTIILSLSPSIAQDRTPAVKEVHYRSEALVDFDFKFPDGTSLFKPWKININYSTDEFVVFDAGNECFYIFTLKGEFVREFSRKGEGPGEIMQVADFTVDSNGHIYVLDPLNKRLSIFSEKGDFLDSFMLPNTIRGLVNSSLRVKNDLITINMPSRGYCFSVLNKKGELIKDIGAIEEYPDKNLDFNTHFSYGFINIDSDNNYSIVLWNAFRINKFDKNGVLVKQLFLDSVFPFWSEYKTRLLPENKERSSTNNMISDIKYRNNRYFIIAYEPEDDDYVIPIFEINNDFEVLRKHVLHFDYNVSLRTYSSGRTTKPPTFDVLFDNDDLRGFIIPVNNHSEVLWFSNK